MSYGNLKLRCSRNYNEHLIRRFYININLILQGYGTKRIQCLETVAALEEDPGWVPSIHMMADSAKGLTQYLVLVRNQAHIHPMHTQAEYLYTLKNKLFFQDVNINSSPS